MSRRQTILDAASDLATHLLWEDRKECEDLPRGEIEAALEAGEITLDEIVATFRQALEEATT